MKRKPVFIFFLVLITVALGFLRDYVFVSINHAIETGNDGNGFLVSLKWILTGFCSILYLGVSCAFVFLLFNSRKYVWITVGVYSFIFFIALLIGSVGYLAVSFEKVYVLVRAILGLAQSPVIVMILVTAYYINRKNDALNSTR